MRNVVGNAPHVYAAFLAMIDLEVTSHEHLYYANTKQKGNPTPSKTWKNNNVSFKKTHQKIYWFGCNGSKVHHFGSDQIYEIKVKAASEIQQS